MNNHTHFPRSIFHLRQIIVINIFKPISFHLLIGNLRPLLEPRTMSHNMFTWHSFCKVDLLQVALVLSMRLLPCWFQFTTYCIPHIFLIIFHSTSSHFYLTGYLQVAHSPHSLYLLCCIYFYFNLILFFAFLQDAFLLSTSPGGLFAYKA